jgi:hypothetical protein
MKTNAERLEAPFRVQAERRVILAKDSATAWFRAALVKLRLLKVPLGFNM